MEVAKQTIWHKGSLGDEDDARTSTTRIAQRKHAILHSMMKTNGNVIECGAPFIFVLILSSMACKA